MSVKSGAESLGYFLSRMRVVALGNNALFVILRRWSLVVLSHVILVVTLDRAVFTGTDFGFSVHWIVAIDTLILNCRVSPVDGVYLIVVPG